MECIGFVGASGTGKSYRSHYVAKQNQISYIIDDGLLVDSKRVLAGLSAKKEKTKIASVRRALFTDDEHAEKVKEAIRALCPDKILILGTSERMIEHVAERLELPPVKQMIRIEDIATPEEIEKALKVRKEQGKHVIPVPTFEIKKDFSGYFIDTLKIILNYGKTSTDTYRSEKSVVRPTFSYMGEFHISDHVLATLAKREALQVENVAQLLKTTVKTYPDGVILSLDILVYFGRSLTEIAREVQEAVKESIENYTAINVLKINVLVKGVEVHRGN